MNEPLLAMQARAHGIRNTLLTEGSVIPDQGVFTRLDAKKKVLW